MNKHLSILILAIALLTGGSFDAKATLYLSNLENTWTQGGIGDIHGLFPGGTPYGSDTARFTTGAGNYELNSVTLEFEVSGTTGAGAWDYINLQLFLQTSGGNLLLANLGNPTINPTPTQWPQSSGSSSYTTFIGFTPSKQVTLNALSQYLLVASMPSTSPVSAALVFTKSAAYTSPTDWTMGATTTGNPYANGEFLKLGINATIPEQTGTTPALICAVAILIGFRPLLKRKSRNGQS